MVEPVMQKVSSIAFVGLSHKTLSAFAYFIKKNPDAGFALATADTADVLAIDLDTAEGKQLWQDNDGQRPSLCMSHHEVSGDNMVFVAKPVNSSKFLDGLLKLKEVMREAEKTKIAPVSRQQQGYASAMKDVTPTYHLSADELIDCCGSAKDLSSTPSSSELEAHTYNIEECFLYDVEEAIKKCQQEHSAMQIEGLKCDFYIVNYGKNIVTDINMNILKHVCIWQKPSLFDVRKTAEPVIGGDLRIYETEELLWKMALWTSRGRLPANIKPDQKVHIKSWPNFPRLLLTPDAIKITAVAVVSDQSPVEIASKLKVEQRYVFSLLSAMYVCGHLTIPKQPVTVESRKVASSRFNLFKSILRSAGLSSATA